MAERVILFDGVCNFCSSGVRFVTRRDPKGKFHFATLQSTAGQEALRALALPEDPLQTVILLESGRFYTRSTAVLRIARHLSGLWPLMYLFIVIPAPLRDVIYSLIADNRYRWFGKNDACFIPTPEIRERFLQV